MDKHSIYKENFDIFFQVISSVETTTKFPIYELAWHFKKEEDNSFLSKTINGFCYRVSINEIIAIQEGVEYSVSCNDELVKLLYHALNTKNELTITDKYTTVLVNNKDYCFFNTELLGKMYSRDFNGETFLLDLDDDIRLLIFNVEIGCIVDRYGKYIANVYFKKTLNNTFMNLFQDPKMNEFMRIIYGNGNMRKFFVLNDAKRWIKQEQEFIDFKEKWEDHFEEFSFFTAWITGFFETDIQYVSELLEGLLDYGYIYHYFLNDYANLMIQAGKEQQENRIAYKLWDRQKTKEDQDEY